jgi:hypothetical protein
MHPREGGCRLPSTTVCDVRRGEGADSLAEVADAPCIQGQDFRQGGAQTSGIAQSAPERNASPEYTGQGRAVRREADIPARWIRKPRAKQRPFGWREVESGVRET